MPENCKIGHGMLKMASEHHSFPFKVRSIFHMFDWLTEVRIHTESDMKILFLKLKHFFTTLYDL